MHGLHRANLLNLLNPLSLLNLLNLLNVLSWQHWLNGQELPEPPSLLPEPSMVLPVPQVQRGMRPPNGRNVHRGRTGAHHAADRVQRSGSLRAAAQRTTGPLRTD